MNQYSRSLGMVSSLLSALLTALFAIFVALNNEMVYFTSVLFLAMAVVIMVISLKAFITPEKKVFAEIATAFGVIYAVLVSIVYYTQIAVVLQGTLSGDLLWIVADSPGTVFFFIDMLGYCFLCLSTLFIAFAVGRKNRLLLVFLLAHSVMFIPTFLLPFLPINFGTGEPGTSEVSGALILVLWAAIFAPVCLLLTRYFKKQKTESDVSTV
jgi:hypothetical protein